MNQETLETFNKFWLKFDPKGKSFINVMQITQLFDILLEEEVTQVRNYNKMVEQGKSEEEGEKGVFLFNLHKDPDL